MCYWRITSSMEYLIIRPELLKQGVGLCRPDTKLHRGKAVAAVLTFGRESIDFLHQMLLYC